MIGQTISHYKILEKLGEGGMGVVYKAQDTKLKRTVALKFLPRESLSDTEAKARFLHEAQAASALNHANITTIYEIYEVQGECFICMEYIEGKSIKELIKGQKLSIEEIIRIAIQVAEGLSKAHQKEIVHRDIKSDNILITHDGLAKIMDFGLAKLKGATKLTKTGSTIGTLQYMSPEQAQGIEVDQRSDIFSFGVVLYEMITGQLPFKGEHEAAIIYSLVNETPEPLSRYKSNVPEELQRIVDKALQKDRGTRYQSAVDIMADLKGLQKEVTIPGIIKSKKKLIPVIVSTIIVLILVFIFLIFKPFGLEISPDKEAIARENTLAVMYFENIVDREDSTRLGEIVTNLLIADLSESDYMRVISSQRLYDILKLLGREGEKKIDREVATQIATKANASWMLFGNILQVQPQIIMTSQLVDVGSGKVTASEHITGEPGEKIFSLVDKLTVELKKDLSLPSQALKENDRQIADVTTHSMEAYRYYIAGLDYLSKFQWTEGVKSFEKALEYDSTFAMAYYQLANFWWNKEDLAKALQYSDKVTHKEKNYIKSLEAEISRNYTQAVDELKKIVERYPDEKGALLRLGEHYRDYLHSPEEAVRQFTKIIELDPFDKEAYDQLSATYNGMGDFEKSLWAINSYISLVPNEPQGYYIRGGVYASNGRIDQAIDSYKKAIETKSDFYLPYTELGNMYLFRREYAKAESCYQEVVAHGDNFRRSWGRAQLAMIPLYQGKFKLALQFLDDAIAADRLEHVEDWQNLQKYLLRAYIWSEINLDSALGNYEKYMELDRKHSPSTYLYTGRYYIRLLAEKGDFKRAQEIADSLKQEIEATDKTEMPSYWCAIGCIELAKGNLKASIANFEKLVKEKPAFPYRLILAEAYFKSNMIGEAVVELEKLLLIYDDSRLLNAIKAVKAYYLLALAYEKSGWNNKAVEKYEEFLKIWKNADPGIKEIEDAKERLMKLKGKR